MALIRSGTKERTKRRGPPSPPLLSGPGIFVILFIGQLFVYLFSLLFHSTVTAIGASIPKAHHCLYMIACVVDITNTAVNRILIRCFIFCLVIFGL